MPALSPNYSNPVTSVSSPTGNTLIDALIGGTKWGGAVGTGATVYYSFPTSNSQTYWSSIYYKQADAASETHGFSALNSFQQSAATSALQSWANVANINIQQVSETASAVGDIRFGFTSNPLAMAPENYAYAFYPTLGASIGGDIWLNPNPPATGANFNVGASGYQTLVHEIGHALGLDHSFVNVNIPGDVGLPYQYEQFQYSVMSYSDTASTYDNGYSGFYPTTPMLMDIQAIQYLYGANTTYHTGDDVYVFDGTTKYYETIWDAGGNDTIQYVSNTSGTINLNAGTFSQLGAPFLVAAGTAYHYDNVAIAYNVIIENAIGGSGNDWLIGNEHDNRLTGNAGADVLKGGAGVDTMDGGAGFDTYYVDSEFDVVIELLTFANQGGIDTVYSTASFILSDNVENLELFSFNSIDATGNTLNNRLIGNTKANRLDGGAGNDTMNGGLGNDTYVVDSIFDIIAEGTTNIYGGGIDTVEASVTRTLGLNFDNLTLTGTVNINAIGNELANVLIGNTGNNILAGGLGTDTLQGNAGDDTLNGGVGNDNMDGGDGNDIYLVNSLLDVTAETNADSVTGGVDEVRSNVSLILNENIEKLSLLAVSIDPLTLALNNINGTGNGLANTLIGNGGNNILSGLDGDDALNGGAGDDSLDGGVGADSLIGGAGNDIYVVDDLGDIVIETLTIAQLGGIDTVKSAISYTLGANVDRLTLLNVSSDPLNLALNNINGTGNALNNILIGNGGDNTLDGKEGADTLLGGAGIDMLDGGTGNDSMNGGLGNDIYIVDSILDVLTEGAANLLGGGIDTVNTSVSRTLGANFDNLILTGISNINAIGNELDNLLTGNDGNNIINGGLGKDTINGGLGNDTLDGGAGIDSLTGGDGDDTYRLDFVAITNNSITTIGLQDLYELDSAGNDTVAFRGAIANTNYQDFYLAGTTIENFDFSATGLTKVNLFGDDFANRLVGNAAANSITGGLGNDTLIGGLGLDTLIGGHGDDTYFVNSLAEINLTGETVGGGIDTLNVGFTHSLNDNFENLTLLTVSFDPLTLALNNINGTGNSLNNTLIGNGGNNILNGLAGDDTLNGGLGADTLIGGTGNDTYTIDNALDKVIELAGAGTGTDTINSSVSYSLVDTDIAIGTTSSFVENLTLTGALAINGVGNALNNTLTGNNAANILNGLVGDDSINGGAGNDVLVGGIGIDTLDGGEGSDIYFVSNLTDKTQAEITDTGLLGIDELRFSAIVAGTLTVHAGDTGLERVVIGTGTAAIAVNTGLVALNVDASAASNALTMIGNAGANSLIGGASNDTLLGGAGNDSLIGGAGNDSLIGGLGNDNMNGGDGNDIYLVNSVLDITTESTLDSAIGGIDEVRSNVSHTLKDNIENLTLLTVSIDPLTLALNNINGTGNGLANTLIGNGGNNILSGLDGDDALNGGAGNDVLIGGVGADILTGGLGADRFDFNSITESAGLNIDTIADFSHVQLDKIDLSTIDAKAATPLINDVFTFIGNNIAFSNLAGQLMFDTATHSIYGDVNGDSVADFQIILTGVTSLVAADFIL